MALEASLINDCYLRFLGRQADQGGLQYFQQLQSLVDVEHEIVASEEFLRTDRMIRNPRFFHSWKICVLEEARIVFVPIAKCAHTSILSAIFDFNKIDWRALRVSDAEVLQGDSDDALLHSALGENKTGLLLRDHSPEFGHRILCDPEWLRVAVVRDPVTRFSSAYNHFFLQWRSHPLGLRHIRTMLDAIGDSAGDGSFSSDACVEMAKVMKYIMTQRGGDLDPHFAPQYEYLSGMRMDRLVPIERLDILEDLIAERSGRSFNIERRNVRRDTAKSDEGCCAEVRELIEEHYWLDRLLYEKAVREC